MIKHCSFWLAIAILLVSAAAFAQVGVIEGTVSLPGNTFEPAPGATVTIYHEHNDSLVTTTSDNGHFRFGDVPVGNWSARATLEGYEVGEGPVTVVENHTARLDLMLRPLATGVGRVEGLVLLPEHNGPAAGAVVSLRQMMHDSLTATADSMGHFVFENVPVGQYSARATLEGYLAAEAPVWVMDGRTANLTLLMRTQPTGGGAVEGSVLLPDQTPAHGASVELAGQGNDHTFYRAETNGEGHFSVQHVAAGTYSITAMLPMHGFASDVIEVVANQTTHVTMVLADSSHGGGHHQGDSLTVVDLQGTAIVVHPDSISRPHRVLYFLDVDGDGAPDYRLSFGPAWYDPGNGAHRPANGDVVTIHGGLLTYADPPMVVVYEINGLAWRRPFIGHGGNGGGDHGHDGCNPDSVTRVELDGTAMVMNQGGFHGDRVMYALNTDHDNMPNYMLDFGRADYDPGNGAQRPANGDSISIVGGEVLCPNMMTPVVIVYEINGQPWREPGDTLGLGPVAAASVGPIRIGTPVSYLTAHNYPNPFNPTTVINYSVPLSSEVKVAVYDLTGRKVADLVNSHQEAGNYAITFDGHTLSSGIYFCRVTAGNQSFTSRMLLLK